MLAITLTALASPGCSLALMAPAVVDGQAFAVEHANELRAGMTSAQVRSLLGDPLRQRTRAEATVWTYQMKRQLRECRFYLGPIPLQPLRTESHGLELVFGSGGLETAVYREEQPDQKTVRKLVGGVG